MCDRCAGRGLRGVGFLLLLLVALAVDAGVGVGPGVEAIEADEVAAGVAEAEILGLLVEPAECFLDAVEVAAFLAGEKQHLLPLHGVGTEVCHVIGVGIEVGIALFG